MSERNRKSGGEYEFSYSTTCRCGHAFGQHTSASPHECLGERCDDCSCMGFSTRRRIVNRKGVK